MSRIGFCSGSYASQSLSADAQQTLNWYPEKDESGAGKSDITLYPTPGLAIFAQLGDTPVRGIWKVQTPGVAERCFVVSGSTLFEILSDGSSVNRGAVPNDGKPASMANSNIQLMVASGGSGYCLTFATNTFTGPIANINGVVQVGYSDGFFVALIGNSAQIFVSNPLDGTTWPGGQSAIVSVFPDNIVGMIIDHREIFLLGTKQSQGYYDSGNTFPYDVIPGAFIEQGTAATFGNVKADNTVFGIWQDERGNGVAFRAQGYTPQRISTHAIEFAWQGYSRIDDAEAYSYQDQGHTFVVWYFPTANKTWVYDVATGLWHERAFWDGVGGTFTAHRSRCHALAFGKHLVGDWASGTVYQMKIPTSDGAGGWTFVTDFGNPILRTRRTPYTGTAGTWNFFQSFEILAEPGLGPNIPLTDGSGNARDPQFMFRFSNDGAKTWTAYQTINAGQIGKYKTRTRVFRLGRVWGSIGRVFEVSTSDAIPWRLIDADVIADPDFRPQKRLASELRERA